jgi:hypothetical protein
VTQRFQCLDAAAIQRRETHTKLAAGSALAAPGDLAFRDDLRAVLLKAQHERAREGGQVRGAHVHTATADVNRPGLERRRGAIARTNVHDSVEGHTTYSGNSSLALVFHLLSHLLAWLAE